MNTDQKEHQRVLLMIENVSPISVKIVENVSLISVKIVENVSLISVKMHSKD